jgi:chromate transporter
VTARGEAPAATPSWREAVRYGTRLGFVSFGGPAGQIAILHRDLVVARRWVSAEEFSRALSFCLLLPGPEALQLVIYLGWRWHGMRGGIVAGLLFIGPAVLLLTALSSAYVAGAGLAPVGGVLLGLQATVVALLADALIAIARRTLHGPAAWLLAALAFALLRLAALPFPLLMLGAGLAGAVFGPRQRPAEPPPAAATPGPGHALRVLAAGIALGALPLLALGALATDAFAAALYRLVAGGALVSFGGAYSLLAYLGHEFVAVRGWLTEPQLVAGFALAETTPGPLVIVLQFLGFVAGWHHPGALGRTPMALLAMGLALWATFLPSFVMVLAGAPYLARLRPGPRVAGAVHAVAAAVVGVIANFAVTVATAVFLPGGVGGPSPAAALIAVGAFVALRRGLGTGWLLAAGAAAGLVATLAGAAPR